ncbi:MAG: ribosome maturation factor RimM [Deltaproteobacteria bacterium]|jgi:16S rRNA processing protein RimM|nr:ribosome maturation factor RimM [Deltaproteobacteria bacterium]
MVNYVHLGRILRPHGVHGAVLIQTFGHDPLTIFGFDQLWLVEPNGGQRHLTERLTGKLTPKGIIAHLKDCTTREAAENLRGYGLAVERSKLPPPEPDEFYQTDLLGLAVTTTSGRELGRITRLMENGAGLILVIENQAGTEVLVPFTDECVPEVNLNDGLLLVAELPGLLD